MRKIIETLLIGLMLTAGGGIVMADPLARAQTASEHTQDNQQTEQQRNDRRRQELLEMERRHEQQHKHDRLNTLLRQRQRRQTEEPPGRVSTADLKEECDLSLEIREGVHPNTIEACRLAEIAKWQERCMQKPADPAIVNECRLLALLEHRRQIQGLAGARLGYSQLKEECELKRAGTLGPWPDAEEVCKAAEFAREEEEHRGERRRERQRQMELRQKEEEQRYFERQQQLLKEKNP